MKKALFQMIYIQGHMGGTYPRFIRRLFAGTEMHRAWVLGSKGFFVQDGISYGPANPYGLTIPKEIET